jgi:spore coat-associated protein N
MSRFKALWASSPRTIMAALFAVFAASALAVGSGANFNSTSANPSNVLSAGTLSQSNSKADAAILTADKLTPGDSASGTVDIENTGDVNGAFTLLKSSVADVPVSPAFSELLNLKVEDLGDPACASSCPAAQTVYSGNVADMASLDLGTYAAGDTHRYKFTVTFPNGTAANDNAYAGAKTTVGYSFESTS